MIREGIISKTIPQNILCQQQSEKRFKDSK